MRFDFLNTRASSADATTAQQLGQARFVKYGCAVADCGQLPFTMMRRAIGSVQRSGWQRHVASPGAGVRTRLPLLRGMCVAADGNGLWPPPDGLPRFSKVKPEHVAPAIDAAVTDFESRLAGLETRVSEAAWREQVTGDRAKVRSR